MRDGIVIASQFAAVDSYRAATHNKGIMNGIDAVALATGNDWRAVEAGAHAYAARGTHYTSLSRWTKAEGRLAGRRNRAPDPGRHRRRTVTVEPVGGHEPPFVEGGVIARARGGDGGGRSGTELLRACAPSSPTASSAVT